MYHLIQSFVAIAHAETTLKNPLGDSATVDTVLNKIITQSLALGAIVVSIVIVLAAFQMLFAQGNPETFKKGRNAILYAVIAYIVLIMAAGIAKIVESALK